MNCHDVDPMNMSVYCDVVSDTQYYASPSQLKKCIQVYVSNLFKHNSEDNAVIYAVMTNLHECVWYMKSDFIVSCLKGLEKTVMFQQEYIDFDMSWIDSFTDFLIHAVEHGIDKYKKSQTGKPLEMIILPVTLYDNAVDVTIEEQVHFVFEGILRRVFSQIQSWWNQQGKMLLDFLETKQQDNF